MAWQWHSMQQGQMGPDGAFRIHLQFPEDLVHVLGLHACEATEGDRAVWQPPFPPYTYQLRDKIQLVFSEF
jgi:hypothetical protein